MVGQSGTRVSVRPLSRLERWRKCEECRRLVPSGEIEMYVATIYDRGRFIVRACLRCVGRRRRLRWLEKRSLQRLEARIGRLGFGCGAELELTRRRLGLESSMSGAGRDST